MRALRPVAVACTAFVAMEGVAYAAHRWVMHGPGRAWHESHHRPREGTFERNDLYPLTFAAATVLTAAVGTTRPRWRPTVLALTAGITAYGAAYAVVHDGVIHRRLGPAPTAPGRRRYGRWVAAAHAEHHAAAGEPFGMLLPVTARRTARATRPGPLAAAG